MGSWLTPDLLAALTPAALCGLFVLLTLIGYIRPKRAVDEVRADRDARLEDKDAQIMEWREAHRLSEAAREKQADALRDALEIAKVTEDALKGFRAAAARILREEGEDV